MDSVPNGSGAPSGESVERPRAQSAYASRSLMPSSASVSHSLIVTDSSESSGLASSANFAPELNQRSKNVQGERGESVSQSDHPLAVKHTDIDESTALHSVASVAEKGSVPGTSDSDRNGPSCGTNGSSKEVGKSGFHEKCDASDRSERTPVPWPITSTSGNGVDYSQSMRLGLPSSTRETVLLAECATRPRLEDDEAARERRWHGLCEGVTLLAGASASTVEALRQLSRRSRQGGIPRSLRAIMWLTLTGMAQKLDENEYFCAWLLRRNGYVTGRYAQAIAADLDRTFPGHPYFSQQDVGLYKLRNVLHALCWRNPLLNYCQSFNYIAGFLLLVFDDEERAFWMLTHILETLLPNDYFEGSLLGTRVDQVVFEALVAAKLPRLAKAMKTIPNFDICAVLPPWVMSLYVNTLPPETTLRVWDYMFTESQVIAEKTAAHLEVALAILKLNTSELLLCEDAGDVMGHLRDATEAMFDADALIAAARSLAIAPAELHALRRRVKPIVLQEIRQQEEQRQATLERRIAESEIRRRGREKQRSSQALEDVAVLATAEVADKHVKKLSEESSARDNSSLLPPQSSSQEVEMTAL